MAVRKKAAPSLERVREVLKYNPETGLFSWATSRLRCSIGKPAGWKRSNGHIGICIDRVDYIASRIAWFYVTGKWPEEVDHVNLNPSDNRWENLRECSHQENLLNRRMPKTNRSGFKGVQLHTGSGKWRARLRVNGEKVLDGLFYTPEEAHAAYVCAADKYHGEFARAA